jgi:alanine dehydrogenase
MIVGIPKEIKDKEFRVGIVPAGVKELTGAGHQVLIESGAGIGSGISDQEFQAAGAEMIDSAATVYGEADLVMKVKEPLEPEYQFMRQDLILFTYLHLAPLPELTRVLLDSKTCGIAYETVEHEDGTLPLLRPMSEVAGRMSIHVGAHYLEKETGGRGILLGGAEGVEPGHVVILGSGTVGANAAQMALGLGASVTVMCRNPACQIKFNKSFEGQIKTRLASKENICDEISRADLVIGAVLVPGATAPKLITRDMLALMQKGSVIIDVSIDQGGCVETARPTTHSDPIYEVDGIIHYCVANMPGAVPRTSTFALSYVTLPYALAIAEKGLMDAIRHDPALEKGLNTCNDCLLNREVAQAQGREFTEIGNALNL